VTVSLTGSDLTIEDVVAIARGIETPSLDPGARASMDRAREVVDRALERGDGAPRIVVPDVVEDDLGRRCLSALRSRHPMLLYRCVANPVKPGPRPGSGSV
jgi:hypothetical protein